MSRKQINSVLEGLRVNQVIEEGVEDLGEEAINEAKETETNIDYLIQDLQNAKKKGIKMVKCKGTLWFEDPAKGYSEILMTTEKQM